jgi:hypothetical protein
LSTPEAKNLAEPVAHIHEPKHNSQQCIGVWFRLLQSIHTAPLSKVAGGMNYSKLICTGWLYPELQLAVHKLNV